MAELGTSFYFTEYDLKVSEVIFSNTIINFYCAIFFFFLFFFFFDIWCTLFIILSLGGCLGVNSIMELLLLSIIILWET